jgi:protein MpaA
MRRAGVIAVGIALLAGLDSPTSTPALAMPAVPHALVHRVVVVGRSVEGRPIEAIEVGNPDASQKELVVGCIHGTECAGIAVADTLAALPPQSRLDLWIVPDLNPDGDAAGARGNAHGVDLNRNFPWRWKRLKGVFYSGPHPLSEPESRFARRLILRIRPQVSIWFHQHLDVVDESGGRLAVERRFATLAGMRLKRLAREPGSVVGWENHLLEKTTAFVVELPAGAVTTSRAVALADAALAVGGGTELEVPLLVSGTARPDRIAGLPATVVRSFLVAARSV